jgi:alcohol dehydrogenase class IV
MDALAHCLEAYCAPGFHPMADGIAAQGIKLIREWLPRAVREGSDLDARGHMLAAASMGATAFQKGLGGMHALSHPIGALHGSHHGLTNAVLMPYVLAFNRTAIEDRITHLAAYIGLPDASFGGFLDWILERTGRIRLRGWPKSIRPQAGTPSPSMRRRRERCSTRPWKEGSAEPKDKSSEFVRI